MFVYHRVAALVIALAATTGCLARQHGSHAGGPLAPLHSPEAEAPARAGIAIVGRGSIAGWEQITIVDSATARYMTVTRGPCGATCVPFDSAAGTVPVEAIAHIYDVVRDEKVFALPEDYGTCPTCSNVAIVTTAVFANNQRKVITSNAESTPEILGRVHMAVAEAIRSAREPR